MQDRVVWPLCLVPASHLTSAGLPVSLKVPLFQGCCPCDMKPGPSCDRAASSAPPSASSLASAMTCTQLPPMTSSGSVVRAWFRALQALPHKPAFISGWFGSTQHSALLSQGYIETLSNAHSRWIGCRAGTRASHY